MKRYEGCTGATVSRGLSATVEVKTRRPSVLQLVWKALEILPPEERQKPVFIIASDTRVDQEAPR